MIRGATPGTAAVPCAVVLVGPPEWAAAVQAGTAARVKATSATADAVDPNGRMRIYRPFWSAGRGRTRPRAHLGPLAEGPAWSVAVVITSLEDLYLFVIGPVHEPVLVVDAARPGAG